MLDEKLKANKDCVFCKLASGGLFFLAATLYGIRTKLILSFFQKREKVFNLSAVGFLYTISYLNFRAAT